MHKLPDITEIASALGRFQNKALIVCDGKGLLDKLYSRGILKG